MIFEMIVSFAATLAFAVIFDVSRGELIFCGISGLAAESVYRITVHLGAEDVFAVLSAAVAAAAIARSFANIRRAPVTGYLVSGIIPLVPGLAMYRTVFYAIASDYTQSIYVGIETFRTAAAVAIGIFLVFALPNRIFFKREK